LWIPLGGAQVPFASAEDLIIHKLFAARPRDLEDAAGVIRRHDGTLDWRYMETWVAQFVEVPGQKDLPARLDRLRRESLEG
jgi:hypothetical protein